MAPTGFEGPASVWFRELPVGGEGAERIGDAFRAASTSVAPSRSSVTLDWFSKDRKSSSYLVQELAAERSAFCCKKSRCEVSAKLC
jgi:hypothetical protein